MVASVMVAPPPARSSATAASRSARLTSSLAKAHWRNCDRIGHFRTHAPYYEGHYSSIRANGTPRATGLTAHNHPLSRLLYGLRPRQGFAAQDPLFGSILDAEGRRRSDSRTQKIAALTEFRKNTRFT